MFERTLVTHVLIDIFTLSDYELMPTSKALMTAETNVFQLGQ